MCVGNMIKNWSYPGQTERTLRGGDLTTKTDSPIGARLNVMWHLEKTCFRNSLRQDGLFLNQALYGNDTGVSKINAILTVWL